MEDCILYVLFCTCANNRATQTFRGIGFVRTVNNFYNEYILT